MKVKIVAAFLVFLTAFTALAGGAFADEEENTDWEQYVSEGDLVNETDAVECPYRVFYEENGATLREYHALRNTNYKPFSVLYLGGITKEMYNKYMERVRNDEPFSVDIVFGSDVGTLYLYSTCERKNNKAVETPGAFVDSNYSVQIAATLEPFEKDDEMIYAFTIYSEGIDDELTEQVRKAKEIIAASETCTVYVQSGDRTVDEYGHIGEYTAPVTAYFKTDVETLNISAVKDKQYKGLPIEPNVTVKDVGIRLKEGTDYTVKFRKNDGIGNAEIVISGKGKYTGSVTKAFAIIPKKVGLKATVKGGKLTLKWGKAPDIDKYLIYRSDDGGAAYKLVYSVKPTVSSKTVKLTDGTAMYRIRAYKKVGKKKIYGEYSKPVTVK